MHFRLENEWSVAISERHERATLAAAAPPLTTGIWQQVFVLIWIRKQDHRHGANGWPRIEHSKQLMSDAFAVVTGLQAVSCQAKVGRAAPAAMRLGCSILAVHTSDEELITGC